MPITEVEGNRFPTIIYIRGDVLRIRCEVVDLHEISERRLNEAEDIASLQELVQGFEKHQIDW